MAKLKQKTKLHYIFIYLEKAYAVYKSLSKYITKESECTNLMYSIVVRTSTDKTDKYWTCTSSPLVPRDINTLFFADNIKEDIINHLNNWIRNESIYNERSLIFKTGILLYGKAGTGKSSMATDNATYLHCGGDNN